MLFITHRLKEVIATCDRATILRDGGAVGDDRPAGGRRGDDRRAHARRGGRASRRRGGRARRASVTRPGAPTARDRRSRCAASCRRARAGRVVRAAARARCSASPRSRARARTSCSTCSPAQRTPDGRRDPRRRARRCKARHPYDAIRAGVVLVPADRLHALLPQRSVAREHRRRRATTASRRWGPISMRDGGAPRAEARSTRCRSTRARAPGAPALGRQPAEGDDRALARVGLHDDALLRPDARDRRRHEAADLRAAAQARRRRRARSSSSRASSPSSRSSATAC